MPSRRRPRPPTCSPDSAARAHSTATGSSSTTRRRSAATASATSPGRPRSPRTRPTTAAAQWLVWEAARRSAPGRRASTSCTWPAPAARSPASPCRRSTSGPRRSTWPGRSYETAAAADVGAVILELARSEQTYTFQRPIDYATSVLAGAIAAGWQRPGLPPGRPLPVQRQEVRRRPGGDDRGDPARLPARDRRRLPQHRHRLLDARRPVEAERRRAAARELRPRGRADRAHPVARGRRRHDQRRRRDRRGRQGELDRGASCAPTSTATDASSTPARPGAIGHLARSASRPGTSHGGVPLPDGGVAEVKLDFEVLRELGEVARRSTGSPAPSSTARRRCPTSCSIASRPSRRPRSTSRPASRTRSTSTRRSRRSSTARSRRGASRTPPTSASPARPTSSSSTRPARRRSGRSSAQLWDLTTKDEILAAQRRKIAFLFTELGVNGSRAMVDRYVHPVEHHRPIPDSLRAAVAAR